MNIDANTVTVHECLSKAPINAAATIADRFSYTGWDLPEMNPASPIITDNTTVASINLKSAYPWVRQGLQNISKLGALDEIWHEFGVAPPNFVASQAATRVLQYLSAIDFRPDSIDASVGEGICIHFLGAGRRANVECFNTGEIIGATVKKGAEPFIWEMTDTRLSDGIARIYSFIRD